ncbi:predicted protein [Lichtheimia corymbifera JMRC:FSU:9682]|uniref:Uncharacterized protein n=1 Tax=Lichtheimia corymbifera JMRC:FSU:9682 TaxID=1263082 RepID=A0A068RSN9_9FUNG|nr:predicted protein [Lichtheimia corymbifera JMRC:FSU:9682]
MKVSYRLIMSAARRNSCIFWGRKLLISGGSGYCPADSRHSSAHVSYGCVTSAASNDGYVPFGCYQGLSIAQRVLVKYRPLPLEIHCSSANMDGMEIRFLFEGRALLRSSTRIRKAFPWLYHWSLGHFLCMHLQQLATTSISFGVVKVYLVRLWFWSSTILLMDIQLRVHVIGGSYQQLAQKQQHEQQDLYL